MKTTRFKKLLSFFLCVVLIAAITLLASGCFGEKKTADDIPTGNAEHLGEGEKSFNFTVRDAEGNTLAYVINTDAETVGQALLDLRLIDGDKGQYGLYVKSVCGKRYDYQEDGKYWAFFINGEYGRTGADQTKITNGATYSFQVDE